MFTYASTSDFPQLVSLLVRRFHLCDEGIDEPEPVWETVTNGADRNSPCGMGTTQTAVTMEYVTTSLEGRTGVPYSVGPAQRCMESSRSATSATRRYIVVDSHPYSHSSAYCSQYIWDEPALWCIRSPSASYSR